MWPSHMTERGHSHGRRGAREFRAVLADGSTSRCDAATLARGATLQGPMRRFATVLPALLAVVLCSRRPPPPRASCSSPPATARPRSPTSPRTASLRGSRSAAVSRAAAAAPDGSRGYIAAGTRVLGIDLTTRLPVGAANLRGAPGALAVSADGVRLYAARRGAIDVIDAATFAVLASVPLPRASNPTSLAVSGDGTRAAATIDRRHVMIASLERFATAQARRGDEPRRGRVRPRSARRVGVLARRARRAPRALRPRGPVPRALRGRARRRRRRADVLADRPPRGRRREPRRARHGDLRRAAASARSPACTPATAPASRRGRRTARGSTSATAPTARSRSSAACRSSA